MKLFKLEVCEWYMHEGGSNQINWGRVWIFSGKIQWMISK